MDESTISLHPFIDLKIASPIGDNANATEIAYTITPRIMATNASEPFVTPSVVGKKLIIMI